MMTKISAATPEDAEEILGLQKLTFRSEAERYNKFEIPPLVETLDKYLPLFDGYTIYKLERNGRILGSVNIRTDENNTGHIGRLIVHPDAQNQGIGKQLMTHVETDNSQVVRFELFAGYRTDKNIRFYEKQGYTTYETIMQNDNFGFVRMEKDNA